MPAHTQLIRSRNEPQYNVFGPLIQFLVPPAQASDAFALMRSVVRPGVAIPLHSHADPVVFAVLEGELQFLQHDDGCPRWRTALPGEIICVPSDVKHALRNCTETAVAMLVASTPTMYGFFRELGTPLAPNQASSSPMLGDMHRLLAIAAKHNYWIASARENAAIGLTFPAREAHAYQTW
jgi:quercetin dioxygenase-like cupin family protein